MWWKVVSARAINQPTALFRETRPVAALGVRVFSRGTRGVYFGCRVMCCVPSTTSTCSCCCVMVYRWLFHGIREAAKQANRISRAVTAVRFVLCWNVGWLSWRCCKWLAPTQECLSRGKSDFAFLSMIARSPLRRKYRLHANAVWLEKFPDGINSGIYDVANEWETD